MDVILGMIFLFISLAILASVTIWSRGIIDFIQKKNLKTAREILKAWHERKKQP